MGNMNKIDRAVRNTNKLKGIFLHQMWITTVQSLGRRKQSFPWRPAGRKNPSRALKKMMDSIIAAVHPEGWRRGVEQHLIVLPVLCFTYKTNISEGFRVHILMEMFSNDGVATQYMGT